MSEITLAPAQRAKPPASLPPEGRSRPAAGLPDDVQLAALTRSLAAGAAEQDAGGGFPHANFALLRAQGLLGLAVLPAWGGPGGRLADARRLVAAVARGEPATALILVMQLMLTRALGHADCRWPAALRERVLRSAVNEGALGNHLRVEPELGSPARGGLPATVARRTGDGWRLSGHKLYTTGIDGLRWLVVWGRTDEQPPRVGQFLVPADAPGLRIQRSWDHLGMRATVSDELLLDDVALPADHAVDIRPPAEWAQRPDLEQQAWMNVLLGTLYDAVARNARDWLLQFLNQRVPGSLGAPLATLARVQEAVGEIEALLLSSRLQLDAATAASDAGAPWSLADSGLLKVAVTRNAIAVTELALRQSGNHGLSRHNPLQRYHRDVLCGRVHTPQEDSALTAAGRAALVAALNTSPMP
ncbi:MAG: acyl-CoA/acyl-ACP dehydrogenase [Burkholderiaceae bacterium]|nr:acyl-CoA/acyl-ACP dehydrogenase [Burkholderiaceae bacterium]